MPLLEGMMGFSRTVLVLTGILLASCVGCGASWAQGSYGDLTAQSNALNDEQRAQARQLFATGFELWKNGDCAAAVLAFGQGLKADPANPQANFYQGDCLQKLRRRDEALEAFKRAAALGAGTAEGFKAQAALESLAKPIPFAELPVQDWKKVYVGDWALEGWGNAIVSIRMVDGEKLEASGDAGIATCPWCKFGKLEFVPSDGSIRFVQSGGIFADVSFRLRLTGPDRMTGDASGGSARGQRVMGIRR